MIIGPAYRFGVSAFLLSLLLWSDPLLAQIDDVQKPRRIVSLDYCADQFVLKLVDRENILAVSPDAGREFSYMRAASGGLKTVRPLAEDVLVLQPDLVVRSYGGGPHAPTFFKAIGVSVLNIGWASRIDGEGDGTITAIIQQVADGLGESGRGTKLVEDFRQRLAALPMQIKDIQALYLSSAGATTGPGSLVHDMLVHAGLQNFHKQTGWHVLPLEKLAYQQPDMVVATFFEGSINTNNLWSASRHPIAKSLLHETPLVALEGALTACGGWFIMDAIEALAAGPLS